MAEERSSRSKEGRGRERSSRSESESGRTSRSESSRGGRSRGETFRQGETPGPGEYRCVTCEPGWQVTLDSEEKRLPPCGKCGPGVTAEYERVGRESSREESRGSERGRGRS